MKQDFKLKDIPKANLYRVPDDYFQKLPLTIMNRVAAPQSASGNIWWSSISAVYRTGLAGFLLTVSFIAAFYFSPVQPGSYFDATGELASINQQEALEYVLGQDTIETGDLAELQLADKDVSAEFMNATATDILETVDEQQLEDVYYN